MSDEQKPKPLWSDERIIETAKKVGNPHVAAAMRSIALEMRHDYEAELAKRQAPFIIVNEMRTVLDYLEHRAAPRKVMIAAKGVFAWLQKQPPE